MPHLTLEYCHDLPDQPNFQRLFAELHEALVSTGEVKLDEIKSRAIQLSDWYMADGDPQRAFVHVKLYAMANRSEGFKRRALQAMQPVLAAHFPKSFVERRFELCLEVVDMHADAYLKVVSSDKR